jgi:hypothetical protein
MLEVSQRINIIKFSRAFSCVNTRSKTNVSETSSVSIIRINVRSDQTSPSVGLTDISIGEVWSLLTYTLMTEIELVSEMLVFDLALTRLNVREFYNIGH